MKTLLEAIQQYPEQFIYTCRARANTTPSVINSMLHHELAERVERSKWQGVVEIITCADYRKPFEGVIFCLDRYSEIDNIVWNRIVDLFEQEKFV